MGGALLCSGRPALRLEAYEAGEAASIDRVAQAENPAGGAAAARQSFPQGRPDLPSAHLPSRQNR
jgi:hypothetical protein